MSGGRKKDSECSPREKKVVEYFIANPGASYQDAADFMGLSKGSIYKYMHQERVNALMDKRLKEEWRIHQRKAVNKMLELVDSDRADIAYKAAAYILDSSGYKAPEKVEVTTNEITVSIVDDNEDE